MEKTQKERLFEDYPIPKAVASLAIPTVLSSLVMVLYNLADTYFVGMLNDPVENAGVALAAPVLLAFNAVNNLFGVGSSSLMSRSLGCKDYETVRRSSAFGFYGALFFGIIFSILCTVLKNPLLALLGADSTTFAATNDYMFWTVTLGAAPAILNVVLAYMVRSEGASMHASIGTMSGCILNIILDPFFVLPWGLDMGAAGAGCATFISNCVACGYFFVLLAVRRKSTYISISPRKFTLEKRIALSVFAVGIPAAIQNLLNVTGMTILNNFTAAYGASAIAAMGITQKVNSVPTQVAMTFPGNHASGQLQLCERQQQAHEKGDPVFDEDFPEFPGGCGSIVLYFPGNGYTSVYCRPGSYHIRREIPEGILTGNAVSGSGLYGSRHFPGGWNGKTCARLCAAA